MTEGLGVEEREVDFVVGVYALASATAAIPLISATLALDRKDALTNTRLDAPIRATGSRSEEQVVPTAPANPGWNPWKH